MRIVLATLLMMGVPALAATPTASSEGANADGEPAKASLAFDGRLSTGWAEGANGGGAGEWLELKLDRTTPIKSVSIWPGYIGASERKIKEYGRPHTVTVQLLGGAETIETQVRVLDPATEGMFRQDIPIEGDARAVRIILDEVVEGGIRSETFIAEVAINFTDGETPKAVVDHFKWVASEAGQKVLAENKEAVTGLFEAITSDEMGDRESLNTLMSHATDGVPALVDRVSRVPAGFRMSALPPDLDAVKALIKIGDANAIPAVTRAALRSKGKVARGLAAKAEELRAAQEITGASAFNVPAFGRTGVAQGELKSLEEPLSITVDSYGGMYIADVANHRVQRFNFDGLSEQTWGVGEAAPTTKWFHKTVRSYAAAHTPSADKGGFTHPVAITTIPGKDFDEIAILDSKGRVSIIGGSQQVERVFQLADPKGVMPNQGGEASLSYAKKALYAQLGDRVIVIDPMEGTEKARFDLEDGIPSQGLALKNGKFVAVHGRKLVMYSTDGFRHGDLLNGTLPTGFEQMSVAFDQAGKLWVLTDSGWAIKYKKPGVVDRKVRVAEYKLKRPRFAALDDMLFITTVKDNIVKVDTMELEPAE